MAAEEMAESDTVIHKKASLLLGLVRIKGDPTVYFDRYS